MSKLTAYLKKTGRAAVALSGGVDSAVVLHAAKAAGVDVAAYTAAGVFQPLFEISDAMSVANACGVPLKMVPVDVLDDPQIVRNGADRCYHCKRLLLQSIRAAAHADGYDVLLDGTNASDDAADRPGMQALREAGVCSPLAVCGMTKMDVRAYARAAGLTVADKPAYACLATRIPADMPITAQLLNRVERAEGVLFEQGYTDFRVRVREAQTALLQLTDADQRRAAAQLPMLAERLRPWFAEISIDPVPKKGT